MIIAKNQTNAIDLAVAALLENKVVILPTDTIYGFSGIVPGAKQGIIAAKGRDEGKPFIELIAKPEDLEKYAPKAVRENLLALWPGAVTIIVRNLTGGTTAFRCPGDPWLRRIIELTGTPIYSTSVNRSGEPSLKTIAEIISVFGDTAGLIVDAGDCAEAKASTIVDATESVYRVIRQGAVEIPAEFLRPN